MNLNEMPKRKVSPERGNGRWNSHGHVCLVQEWQCQCGWSQVSEMKWWGSEFGEVAEENTGRTLWTLIRMMGSQWNVLSRGVMPSKLCFESDSVAIVWRTDCRRLRLEIASPLKRLLS